MSRRQRSPLALGAIVVLAIALLVGAGCGGSSDNGNGGSAGPGAESGVIKLGYNLELSGPAAILGYSRQVGGQVAVDEINEAGGVKVGDETYELELVIEDNRTDPTAGVRAAEDIANEGVLWSVAPDAGFEGAYEIYKENGIITNGNGGVPSDLLETDPDGNPLLFHEFATFQQYVHSHLKQMRSLHPDAKRLGVLLPDDANGRVFAAAWEEFAPELGFELVATEMHPPDASGDFSSFLTKLKGADPDIVYLGYIPPVAIAATGQAAQLDVAEVLVPDLLVPPDLAKTDLRGHPVQIVQQAQVFFPGYTPEGAKDIIERFEEEAKGEVILSGTTVAAYVNIQIVKDAIEKAGTVDDTQAIAEAMLEAQYDGPFGPAKVDPSNHAIDMAAPSIAISEDEEVTVFEFPSFEATEPSAEVPTGRMGGS